MFYMCIEAGHKYLHQFRSLAIILQKLQSLLILTHFLHRFPKPKSLTKTIGSNYARARRTAPIAFERRGWHRQHEPEQPGWHATWIEGNNIINLRPK